MLSKKGNKFTMMKPLLTGDKNLYYNTKAKDINLNNSIGSHLVYNSK